MPGKEAFSKSKKKEKAQLTERKKLTTNQHIDTLESEISKTKYNKRTQHAVGLMKAKLAMLREKAEIRAGVGKGKGDDRFSVRRTGDATVLLLGFPSVGKSTLLNKLTSAKSEIAAYSFTTLSAVPGLLEYKFSKIQIIDVPGIVSGAAAGRGRGKEVLAMMRNADLILILIDALFPQHHDALLDEIAQTGVRINQQKPDVKITKKPKGGLGIGLTVHLTKTDKETIIDIAREMRLNNADILIREDIDADQLIDIIDGNRFYTKALTVLTKADLVDQKTLGELKELIKPDVVVAAEKGEGIPELKDAIYNKLGFIKIFLKEVNKKPDMEEPLIMFNGCTIRDVCEKLHRAFVEKFKFARVWGKSAKFDGQVYRKLDKELHDGDILELHIK
ncbi:MAG: 50S ribosome-binding GTPase [Nanoarchaeota archaeon]|nr:50S ribosome-binding GTPase [Nanoarchaeota archaeon]MBU1704426.1 50S ribosome-binding GTPase [Nanoarchaeota archaeon]